MAGKTKVSSTGLKSAFNAGSIPLPEHFHQLIDESCTVTELTYTADNLPAGLEEDDQRRLSVHIEKRGGLDIINDGLTVNIKEDGGLRFSEVGKVAIEEGREVALDDFWELSRAERSKIMKQLNNAPKYQVIRRPYPSDGDFGSEVIVSRNGLWMAIREDYSIYIFSHKNLIGNWVFHPERTIYLDESVALNEKVRFSISIDDSGCIIPLATNLSLAENKNFPVYYFTDSMTTILSDLIYDNTTVDSTIISSVDINVSGSIIYVLDRWSADNVPLYYPRLHKISFAEGVMTHQGVNESITNGISGVRYNENAKEFLFFLGGLNGFHSLLFVDETTYTAKNMIILKNISSFSYIDNLENDGVIAVAHSDESGSWVSFYMRSDTQHAFKKTKLPRLVENTNDIVSCSLFLNGSKVAISWTENNEDKVVRVYNVKDLPNVDDVSLFY